MNKYVFGMMALAAMAGGCESSNKQASNRAPLRPAVVDISPTPPVYTAPVQPIQPVTAVQPVEPAAPAAFNSTPALAGGGSYTVKKGDTLYKIAREHYGDGKQWQKIASANPGLSPSSLKVGQKIAIP
jgi:5'-nucleotidase